MTVAAPYGRKSTQAKSRRATSPETQISECRGFASDQGWDVHPGEFVDPDISAYRRADGTLKNRPGFEALKRAIEAGGINIVVCWDMNRITRDVEVAVEFAKVCRSHRVDLVDTRGKRYNLSTQKGYSDFLAVAADAQCDSAAKSEVVSRELAIAAREGAPHGGPAAFGYDRVKRGPDQEPARVVNQAHAVVIRKGAADVLAGKSLRAITAEWRKVWPSATMREVKRTLLAPRIAGLREHTTLNQDGEPTTALYPATWEPIIDRETWDEVVLVLSNPDRDSRRGRPASYVLSGIARCSCGLPLISKARGYGKHGYRCPDNHVGRDKAKLEDFVERVLFASIDNGALARLNVTLTEGGTDPRLSELAEAAAALRKKRARLVDIAGDGIITKADLAQRVAPIDEELARIADSEKKLRVAAVTIDVPRKAKDFPAWWKTAPLASKRVLVRLLLEVTVHPGRRGVREIEGVAVTPLF